MSYTLRNIFQTSFVTHALTVLSHHACSVDHLCPSSHNFKLANGTHCNSEISRRIYRLLYSNASGFGILNLSHSCQVPHNSENAF